MTKAFRRIALAQALLPPGEVADPTPPWTDEALNALLQVDETPVAVVVAPRIIAVAEPSTAVRAGA